MIEILHRVYARGVECEDCQWAYKIKDDGSTSDFGRACSIIDSQSRAIPYDVENCPGVEAELNKEK